MLRSDRDRVVVTGIGLVTPFACDREASWRSLRQGASATRWVKAESADCEGFRHAGAPAALPAQAVASIQSDPVIQAALFAAREAVADARLDLDARSRERIGCVIGTSKGGWRSFTRAWSALRHAESIDFPAALWEQFLPNAPAAAVSAEFGLRGPALCPVAACATGLTSLVRGVDLIRDGYCDIVLAGSTDASLQPAILASFRRLGVLAHDFDDPATACRPFDRDRSGFVVGEGAAVLVLERRVAAEERGVRPYAEWLASATATDVTGLTQLEHPPTVLVRLIGDVLARAGLTADELDYVNLHGTGTRQNDACESAALNTALGPAAQRLACSSFKGGIGHLLGAAGSVETAATLLAMRDGVVPPTVNLTVPDEACDLDYTPRTPRPQPITHALKLSLGFGGHLVAAVLRRVERDNPRSRE
jgi:3-oxoacyl-[acyl-carrier-protein] synthase II